MNGIWVFFGIVFATWVFEPIASCAVGVPKACEKVVQAFESKAKP